MPDATETFDAEPHFTCLACGDKARLIGDRVGWQRQMDAHAAACPAKAEHERLRRQWLLSVERQRTATNWVHSEPRIGIHATHPLASFVKPPGSPGHWTIGGEPMPDQPFPPVDPGPFPPAPPVRADPALMGTVEHYDALTGAQVRQGLSVFAQVLAAATVAGSPVVGFLLNTAGTKTAGMFVSGGAAIAFLLAEGLHTSASRFGHALGTALRQR